MKNFEDFTGLYSLSKTIKNELIPINSDGERMSEKETDSFFNEMILQDTKIKEAYLALKPVLDGLHETVITNSLSSDDAKEIDFSIYFEKYKNKTVKSTDESYLISKICKTYEIGVEPLIVNAGITKKGKPIFKKNSYQILMESGILKYIENNISTLVSADKLKSFINIEKQTNEKGKEFEVRTGHLEVLNKFFTYFEGYNKNRENYYSDKGEATAIATRIVNDNLPKFCDNIILFLSRKDEFLNTYKYLKENNITTQIKEIKTNTWIEAIEINEEVFQISKFNNTLSQQEIENYNEIIGKYNLLINLYNQTRRGNNNFKKLSHFKILYKQIGCGTKKTFIEQIKYDTKKEQENAENNTKEVINLEEILTLFYQKGEKYFSKSPNSANVNEFIHYLEANNDWNGIYWTKSAVDFISNKFFINWHSIKDRIYEGLLSKDRSIKEKCSKIANYSKKSDEQFKINDAVELSVLFNFLDEIQENEKNWTSFFLKETVLSEYNDVIDETSKLSTNLINLFIFDIKKSVNQFLNNSDEILNIKDYKNEDNILKIKNWLDTTKPLFGTLKSFLVKENKIKGNPINGELTNIIYEILYPKDIDWNNWYDLVRNYLTKKPQDDAKKNKLKLNFESSSFLGGMSSDYGTNGALIIKHKNKEFLTIIKTKLNDYEIKFLKQNPNNNLAQRVIYDFQKPDNKNVPRLFIRSKGSNFSPAVKLYQLPIETVIDIYDKGFFKTEFRKTNEAVFKSSLIKLIDYFKLGFLKHKDYSHYPFQWKSSEEYNDIQEFYNDTANYTYQLGVENINFNNLLKLIEDKRLYLFEIYNKDFSQTKGERSKNSKLNLHSMYWKHIFEENSTIKLNGGGEIFYREKVKFDKVIVHKKDEPIQRRTDKKIESRFNHNITKDNRFLSNKFYLHIPITLNYKANESLTNSFINAEFSKSEKVQFLGIDRGEKHLIYYSLLDANGKIIKQNHFDTLNHKDYLKTIKDAAETRKKRQENWQQKGNISNLKDGYISLVVNEIIKLMKDKDGDYIPTYIVLEDLNSGFKRSRQKFEEQTYQKFETAIAQKLNYLVDKNVNEDKLGSVRNAIQLTPEVKTYSDIEKSKQYGNMFYVRANYTSITDPSTGWRKSIYLKKGIENDIKKQIIESFTDIGMDINGDYYFKYNDNTNKEWILWSSKNGKSLDRYRAKRGKDKYEFIIEKILVKDILDSLFINYDKSASLLNQIKHNVALMKINEHTAFETLRFVIDIIQQIRNSGDSKIEQDDNFLLSPIRNKDGVHFDSRMFCNIENATMPKDADANGAYNIARKGIIMLEHIKQWIKDGNIENDLDLFISDKEWNLWCTNKEEWITNLQMFSSKKLKVKLNS